MIKERKKTVFRSSPVGGDTFDSASSSLLSSSTSRGYTPDFAITAASSPDKYTCANKKINSNVNNNNSNKKSRDNGFGNTRK